MTSTQKLHRNLFFLFTISFSFLFFSCNSEKNSLIGGTWKLQKMDTEFKENDVFEKVDSIPENGSIFNELNFLNEKEFEYKAKGIIYKEKRNETLLGGTGKYYQSEDQIVFNFSLQRKSFSFKIDSTQLILIEDLIYEPDDPLVLISENNSEIKIKEVRFTYYYEK